MESDKNISQLDSEVRYLGLIPVPSGKNGKMMKRDYIIALMKYNLIKLYGDFSNIPKNLQFRLSFESPQLAANYFDMKPKEQEAIWDDPSVILVEKINGVRITLVNSNEGYSAFGRFISDSTYIWPDYSKKICDRFSKLDQNLSVDLEVILNDKSIMPKLKSLGYEADTDFRAVSVLLLLDDSTYASITEGVNPFHFKLIDVYFKDSTDLRKLSYSHRSTIFDDIISLLRTVGANISRPLLCDNVLTKKAFHEGIMKDGGEGTIAVFTNSLPELTSSRKKDGMVKIKKSLFSSMFDPNAIHDTIDAYVYNLKLTEDNKLVRSFEAHIYSELGKEICIAKVEAIPLSMRTIGFIEEGIVVELSGTRWSEGMIEDAVVENIRYDKTSLDCKLG